MVYYRSFNKYNLEQGKTVNALAKKEYNKTHGARLLRRLIQSRIEDEISDKVLRKEFNTKNELVVRLW